MGLVQLEIKQQLAPEQTLALFHRNLVVRVEDRDGELLTPSDRRLEPGGEPPIAAQGLRFDDVAGNPVQRSEAGADVEEKLFPKLDHVSIEPQPLSDNRRRTIRQDQDLEFLDDRLLLLKLERGIDGRELGTEALPGIVLLKRAKIFGGPVNQFIAAMEETRMRGKRGAAIIAARSSAFSCSVSGQSNAPTGLANRSRMVVRGAEFEFSSILIALRVIRESIGRHRRRT